MIIKGIIHVGFKVVDMERSLDFYCNKLGFKKAFELNQPIGKPWIVYVKVAEGCFLELFYGGSEVLETERNISVLRGMTSTKRRSIEEKVSTFRRRNFSRNGFELQIWEIDPDGNWLEFMEMNPESPHIRC